jgi:hypothetical protein
LNTTARALFIAGALLGVAAGASPAQVTDDQFWPEIDTYVRLNHDARLFFLLAPVKETDANSFEDTQLGAHFEFGIAPHERKHLNEAYDADQLRYLRGSVGYRETFDVSRDDNTVSERRIVTDLTPRFFLPWKLLVAQRNRVDYRWIEGQDYSWRYRPRVWVERQSKLGSVTLVPHAAVELYYDSRYDSWNRTEYRAGFSVPVAAWFVPQAYYTREIDREPAKKYTNALGVIATLYF